MKKLEELFELPTQQQNSNDDIDANSIEADAKAYDAIPVLSDNILELDKINQALPAVKGLESTDKEMDDLATKAITGFDDLMDLGMNVDSRYASDIFSVASSLLGHAITAKNAKLNKKLKMVELQLKKLQLEQRAAKDSTSDNEVSGTGVVLDRNQLLDKFLNSTNNTDNKNTN